MKSGLFYFGILIAFVVNFLSVDGVLASQYEPQITVGDVALPEVSVPEYVSAKSLPLRVLPLEKGEKSLTASGSLPLEKGESQLVQIAPYPGLAAERFTDGVQKIAAAADGAVQGLRSLFASIGEGSRRDVGVRSGEFASANIITLTNRATRDFLANVVSRADQFGAEFATSPGSRAALTSQTINKVRVTTLRAALADVIAPQITVGEVVVPDLSVPQFLTEPLESQDKKSLPLRVLPLQKGESVPGVIPPFLEIPRTPFRKGGIEVADGRRISLLDRAREAIVRLIAGLNPSPLRVLPLGKGELQPIPPFVKEVAGGRRISGEESARVETGNIPTTVLPTVVRVPEFVSEDSFRAVPPPVAPAPREVVIVERHALSSSSDLAPASPAVASREGWVAANLSAQIGSIAQALAALAEQRNADRSELLKIISDTNNIGRLPNVTLSAPTFSGTVSGLTDESIPNDLSIASTKDITTTGAFTSSAASGTSTITANFAAGTTTVSGVIRVNGTGATSTFAANVDVSGNLRIGGTCISCGGVSSIAGWTDSGILVQLETTSDLLAIGTSTAVSGAVVTVEATTTGAIPLALRGYTGQAADFFRILNASGNRLMFVSSTGGIFSSSTLQAATTTIYGNLGVGTTSPAEQLSVAGRLYVGGTGTSTFENNLQVLGQLKIGTSSAYITDTQITGTSNFTISTQGESNHLVLQTLGRIGVVSTTPWGVFSVEHNGANQNMPVFVIADQGTSTPTMVVDWAGRIMAGTSTPRGWFTINDRGGADTFVIGSSTPRFIVKGDGNVGVGTTSPYALFSVGGNAALGTTTLYGSLILSSFAADPSSATNGQLYYSSADGAIRAYTNDTWGPLGGGFTRNSSTGIVSLFNGSDRLTIGTTSPAGLSLITAEATSTAAIPLTIRGYTSQTANLLQIANSSGTNLVFVNSSGGIFASSTLQAATTTIYGNLGVGTTSPAEQLSVAGRLYVGGTGTSTFENNLQVLGQLKIGTSSAYITDTQISGTSNFTISTQGENNHLRLQTLGRVGVASGTPWGVLSVEHNSANQNMPVFVIADEGTSTPTLVVDWAGKIMAGTSTPRGWFTINDRGGADTFVVGSNTPHFIVKGGGNVGVGTTSPYALFSVGGNAALGTTTLYGSLILSSFAADPSSATNGQLYYSSADGAIRAYTNDTWGPLGGGFTRNSSTGIVSLFNGSDRLTIGTTSPAGLSLITAEATSTAAIPLTLRGYTAQAANLLQIVNSSGTNLLFVSATGGLFASSTLQVTGNSLLYGSLGIATTSPSATLAVQGNVLISGDIASVANVTATATVTTANLAASASTTIDGLYVRLATTTYATTTDLVVTGRLLANTASSTITNLTTTNATATVLTVSSIASTSALVISTTLTSNAAATSTFAGAVSTAGLASSNGLTLSGGALFASSALGIFQYLGVSTTSPAATLAVQGNMLISGNIASVANLTATGTVTTANLAASASSTIDSLYVRNATTTYATTTDFVVTGRLLANTASSTITNLTTTNATATVLTVTDLASTSRLVVSTSVTVNAAATSTFAGGLAVQTNRLVISQVTGAVGVGTTTPTQAFAVHGNTLISGDITSVANLTATGTITQNAFAYTALTASTEKNDVNLNLARTVQFSAGNLATQRAVLVSAPTYAFTASSTLTDASTLLITGAPIAGAFNLATSTYALKIDGATSVQGATTLIPTNAYSLYIAPPTGATNNYALIVTGGASGFGTTSPSATLAVQGNAYISGNLTNVSAITATGTVTTANLAASASSTIDGLYVRNATTTYATTTDLVVTGRLLANTGSSTITNLTTTNATATVFTVSDIASTSRLVVSSNSATSTFTWGIQANLLNITSATATSTFTGGISAGGLATSEGLTITGGAITNTASATSTFTGGISTGGLSSSNGLIISGGSLGVGTTSPYARLSISGVSGNTQPLFVVASSSNATEYFSISSTGTTTIQTLQTGAMTFETNAGAVTWVDLPVNSSAAQQTAESYSAQLDTNDVLTIYGESDGSGGIWRPSVGIGTSTPWGIFSIEHGSIPTSSPVFVIADQGTSSPSFVVMNANGFVGVATATPGSRFSVHGNALISNNLSVAGITATGTVTLANLAASASSTIDGLYVRAATTTYATTTDLVVTGRLLANTASSTITNLTTTNATATVLAVTDLASTSRLTVSSSFASTVSGTSTFAGAISTAGLASSNGLTLSGGALLASSALGIFQYLGVSTSTPGNTFGVHGNALISNTLSIANLIATGTVNVTGLATFANATATQLTVTNSAYLATTGGSVGIGTTSPSSPLHIISTNDTTLTLYSGSDARIMTSDSATVDAGGSLTLGGSYLDKLQSGFASLRGGLEVVGSSNGYLGLYTTKSGVGSVEGLRITSASNVGIGTTSPSGKLHVAGGIFLSDTSRTWRFLTTGGTFYLSNQSSATDPFVITSSDNIGIGGTTTPPYTLTIAGSSNTATKVAIANGGLCVDDDGGCNASTTGRISAVSYVTSASDLAENYYSDEQLEPGDIVVSLGGINVGRSSRAGDKRVLGAVSTRPGIILGLENDNENAKLYPIALTGRVPVKINLQGGAIEVGDPITSSSELGTGMKATTTSMVLGYALEAFDGSIATTSQPRILMFAKVGQWNAPGTTGLISQIGQIGPISQMTQVVTDATAYVAQALSAMQSWLAQMGVVIEQSLIKVKEIVVDMLTARKIVTDQLQMKDKFTGEVYCVELVNGDLVRTKGECAEPNATVNSIPTPDQSAPLVNDATTTPEVSPIDETATTTPEISPIGEIGQIGPIEDTATTTEDVAATTTPEIGQIGPMEGSATTTTEVATTTPAGGE